MDFVDGHTHAFNTGFLPIEGVMLSRKVWEWLASDVTDILERALERNPPGDPFSSAEQRALMDMLEAELSGSDGAAPQPDLPPGLELDLIGKFALLLPNSDLLALSPMLTAARGRLAREAAPGVSHGLPALIRAVAQRSREEAELRVTVDQLLRSAAHMTGPVETSEKSDLRVQAPTGKTLGTMIDLLVLLTQHEIRIARSFVRAWRPSVSFASRTHLMMDMENHYPGRPPVYADITGDQFPRMLAASKASPVEMIGFAAFDPFRPDGLDIVKTAISRGFVGVKFYPPNGYRPIGNKDDEIKQYRDPPKKLTGADVDSANRLFFEWCIKEDIPVFTHCTSTGMESRPKETGKFSDPSSWETLLSSGFRKLRLCFGHAGGQEGWFAGNDTALTKSYVKTVVDLCCKYDNVYCDFGFFDGIFTNEAGTFVENLESVIDANAKFGTRCCYGTDWHLIGTEVEAPKYPSTFQSLFGKSTKALAPVADAFFRTNAMDYLRR